MAVERAFTLGISTTENTPMSEFRVWAVHYWTKSSKARFHSGKRADEMTVRFDKTTKQKGSKLVTIILYPTKIQYSVLRKTKSSWAGGNFVSCRVATRR